MKKYLILICMVVASSDQSIPLQEDEDSTISSGETFEIIEKFNSLRSEVALNEKVTYMDKFLWDEQAMMEAEKIAAGCSFSEEVTKENLHVNGDILLNRNDFNRSIDGWFSGKTYYDYDQNKCQEYHERDCVSYHNIIYKTNSAVGCALNKCPAPEGVRQKDVFFFVCVIPNKLNFDEKTNKVSYEKLYEKGELCDQCLDLSYLCEAGLCDTSEVITFITRPMIH